VGAEAKQRPEVRLLMTHPGVGPVVGLAYVLTLGPHTRFQRGKKVASYLGLIPGEYSSGDRQRFGAISKQGNTLMRTLLVEAAQTAARFDEELRRAAPCFDARRMLVRKPGGFTFPMRPPVRSASLVAQLAMRRSRAGPRPEFRCGRWCEQEVPRR